MQRCVIFSLVVLTFGIAIASSASILDLLYWNSDGGDIKKRDESGDSGTEKSCACNGPICMCCVDFNLTYIDLGGPGCVQMKYISQQDGLAVNVSYGENLLHSEQVKGPNPEPTCMSLLANLAHVCARFSDLLPHNDGLRGCLLLEPKLLGDVTASFNIGCFTMDPQGMRLEETNSTIDNNEITATNTTETDSAELNEEELIAAVNESAEQGFVFFTNLLGLTFGKPEGNNTNASNEISTSQSPTNKIESSTAISSDNKQSV